MFNLGEVQEQENIPIPMGLPSNDGIGVDSWYLKNVKVYDETEKAGCSIGFEFEYRGERKTSNGTPYKGAKFEHREFDPTNVKALNLNDEEKKKMMDGVQVRLKHILGRYIDEEKIKKISKPTFRELIEVIAKGLPSAAANVETTLKLVYDKKGYTKFPKVPSFISTSFSPRPFTYNPQWDILVKENNPQPTMTSNTSSNSNAGFSFDDNDKVTVESEQPVNAVTDDPFA